MSIKRKEFQWFSKDEGKPNFKMSIKHNEFQAFLNLIWVHDFKMLIKPKEFHCFWSIGSMSSSSAAGQPAKQHPLQKRHDFFHKVITNPSLLSQIQPGPVLSRASNLPKHEIHGSSIGVRNQINSIKSNQVSSHCNQINSINQFVSHSNFGILSWFTSKQILKFMVPP